MTRRPTTCASLTYAEIKKVTGSLDFLHDDPKWRTWLDEECARIEKESWSAYLEKFESDIRGSIARLIREGAPPAFISKYRQVYTELKCLKHN